MRKTFATSLLALSFAGASSASYAGLITFENLDALPAGTLVDTQYLASDGVTFASPAGGPFLGKRGGIFNPGAIPGDWGDFEGWQYPNDTSGADEFAPGEGALAGNNFITDIMGADNDGTAILEVTYASAVSALAFDVYDVDGDGGSPERYLVEIFDNRLFSGLPLDTLNLTAGDPDTGDGFSTRLGFADRGVNDILALRVTGSSNRSFFGLGFDNFNTDTFDIPVPAPAALIILGLAGLGAFRRLNRSQASRSIMR
jgi:hypothetical protein